MSCPQRSNSPALRSLAFGRTAARFDEGRRQELLAQPVGDQLDQLALLGEHRPRHARPAARQVVQPVDLAVDQLGGAAEGVPDAQDELAVRAVELVHEGFEAIQQVDVPRGDAIALAGLG